MVFLLFCGHCLHFFRRAAVKNARQKIVYYIFSSAQRRTVENLCPTLNGMQATAPGELAGAAGPNQGQLLALTLRFG